MAVTAVSSTTTSTVAVAANTSRQELAFENSDANRAYILLGSGTASSTNYSFSLAQFENASRDGYRGEVNVVWAGDGTGHLMVTQS